MLTHQESDIRLTFRQYFSVDDRITPGDWNHRDAGAGHGEGAVKVAHGARRSRDPRIQVIERLVERSIELSNVEPRAIELERPLLQPAEREISCDRDLV